MATIAARAFTEVEAVAPGARRSDHGRPRSDGTQGEAPTTPSGAEATPAPASVGNEREVDLALVRRVQSGDKAAFDRLVERYQHRIASVLSHYIRDPVELEDVAQDAFLKAYRGLGRFRGESSFYTWLYRIAVNAAKNHLDAMGRRINANGVEPSEAERYADGALLRHSDTPERQARRGEVQRTIERTLDGLPAHLRDAVMLREMRGLSYEEIARSMGCPVGTVRSRISRGRELIDRAVRPLLDAGEAYNERVRAVG